MCVPKRACFAIAHFHLRATEQIPTLPRATCPLDRLALRLGFAMQGILNPSATKAQADCLALTYQTSTLVLILIATSRATLTREKEL